MAMQQMLGPISGSSAYEIERSLRFNSADSAYLSRTPSSAGNRKTWTWSAWVKRANLGYQIIFAARSSQNYHYLSFDTNDELAFRSYSSGFQMDLQTTAKFRDPSAWYHILINVNTTASTSTDRASIYINGTEVTAFNTATYPSQNADLQINATYEHNLGRFPVANDQGNFMLADLHFIDGTALTASSFGEYDADNNWMPKTYTGSYGTNGFLLKFDDNSSASALGTDSSGNNNTWTVNNLSVATGAGNDSLIDSPTNYTASSGNNGGNYCTFNSIDRNQAANYSEAPTNGNLDTNPRGDFTGTIPVTSGKWYWEITITTVTNSGQGYIGVLDVKQIQTGGSRGWATSQIAAMRDTGSLYGDGSTGSGVSYAQGDILGFALDAGTGKLWIAKNNTWINSGNPAGGTGHAFSGLSYSAYTLIASDSNTGQVYSLNAGQRPFSYTPPTDFVSICTQNLSAPTIADGSTAFDAVTYSGNGTTQTITGINHSPDFVWIKCRNDAVSHQLFDQVRGVGKSLVSNTTEQERTNHIYGYLSAFTSDGFTVTAGSSDDFEVNGSAETYVAWNWDAGADSSKTYTVKVVSDSGNKYRFDDFGSSAVTLDLEEGSTYVFDQSDSSNAGHPLRFSTTANGTHGGGTEYTTGVTVTGTPGQAGAKTTIVVAASAPTLYYYCNVHSGMGGQANTNSTAGASNFDGTIQATVRANQSAGFSIVTYEADAPNNVIGHGLNAEPYFVITKARDRTDNWLVYHYDLGVNKWLHLNLDSAVVTTSGIWGTASNWTNSTFGVSTNSIEGNNYGSHDYLALCWAPVAGYSAFGSYTGNGSSNGPFVYTGFRPSWIIHKRTDTGGANVGDWRIWDVKRDIDNAAEDILFPNRNSAGSSNSAHGVDILSNGFKFRTSDSNINPSGGTLIYAAFAEHPFKTSRAR